MALFVGLLLIGGSRTVTAKSGAVPGRFIVKLAPKVRAETVLSALKSGQRLEQSSLILKSDKINRETWDRLYFFESGDSTLTVSDIEELLGPANIEYVEPEYYLEFFDFPTDSLFDQQWYLHNNGQMYLGVERIDGDFNDYQTFKQGSIGSDINLDEYYDQRPAASTRVVVAIIDSGVDLDHPELQGRFWHNPDEIPRNGLDDDHNGYIDDTLGYDISGDLPDVSFPDSDPTDIIGHGTHIAGIIAASENGRGVVGVAPQAEIMVIKIRPYATSAVGATGIFYAVNAGADIINLSWGSPFVALVVKDALDFARSNGVFVCIAAGNSGGNDQIYPAAFDDAFAVAASNSVNRMAFFSSWGPHIDLVAPGRDILSLRAAQTDMYIDTDEPGVHIVGDDSLYYLADGTSMATPIVAGAAALLWATRPELTLDQLEAVLHLSAVDMLDPLNVGDSLPGVDSISGYGLLDVAGAMSLAAIGRGLYFVSPINHNRYTGEILITVKAIGNYAGGWELAYASDNDPNNWQVLADGLIGTDDSVTFTLADANLSGHVTIRLTDDFQVTRFVRVVLVRDRKLEIHSPLAGAEIDYNIPIVGSVYGSLYDSAALYYSRPGGTQELLHKTTGEYFDSLIFDWNASGVDLGDNRLYLYGYFGSETVVDSVSFSVRSAFAVGWPQPLTGRGALSCVTADLNNDGSKEIIVGTTFGLNVFHADGSPVAGFPVLISYDTRCLPAIYDVDFDGEKEIICTADDGLHVFNYDGSYVDGWPVQCQTGRLGFGMPIPTVTQLRPAEDPTIVFVNNEGEVQAWDFAGDSYFYSLEGWYASFASRPTGSAIFDGNAVTSGDLDGDGFVETVVSFSANGTPAGVGLFDGRTGQPAFGRPSPQILKTGTLYGTVLGDLNGDNLPEIISVGYDAITFERTIWVKTRGEHDLPGWPITLPGLTTWRGTYPMIADLDLDGSPELLFTFFEFDISALYIFRADGSAYRTVEGRPFGEAYFHPSTFGTPVVANLTGDARPEIIIRSGYIFPGTGREQVHILDYNLNPLPGWPVSTPTPASQVFSTPYTPTVDDIDGDDRVELILVSEGSAVYVWNFDASVEGGQNRGRLFMDERNSATFAPRDIRLGVVDPSGNLPAEFGLHQNYPNPFNPTTTISFDISTRTQVTLQIFNILGRRVATLLEDELPAGQYKVAFDGSAWASGVYFYRLSAGDKKATRKMVLVK